MWTVMSPSMKLDLWQREFSHVQGVDYNEIFSSVAMLKSVGIMLALAAFMKSGRWMSKQVSLPVFVRKGCMWYNQKGFVDPKDAKRYAAPAILPWTGVSISELESTLWWDDQRFWVYTKFMRNLYFQRSEWEHYRISDEYMLLTYLMIRNDVEFLESI